MPFPEASVIPDNWAQRHRPVVRGTMRGRCDVGVPSTGPEPYPLPEGWTGLTPLVSGWRCRVVEQTSAASAWATGQQTQSREYLVTLDITGLPDIPIGAIVVVTVAEGDPHLPGRRLRVADVQYGTEVFERDLICVDNLTQNNPG